MLITAIGGGGFGDQILKALRLAAAGKYQIFGTDISPACPQAGEVEGFHVLPPADDPAYLQELLCLCSDWKVQALFPGCEPELKKISGERAAFYRQGIFMAMNTEALIQICMDKEALGCRLKEMGFSVPKSIPASDAKEVARLGWFPVVVKPARYGGGSSNVFLAQSSQELRALLGYLQLSQNLGDFMIQEYTGVPTEEYTVGILHSPQGELIHSIAIRRQLRGGLHVRTVTPNRTTRNDLGAHLVISSGISHGEVGDFPEVRRQCEVVAQALGSRGPLNIQCRLVRGKIDIFEINPRFSGTTSLRALVGLNEPDLFLKQHLLGGAADKPQSYSYGNIYRRIVETFYPTETSQ